MAREREELRRQQEQLRYEQEKRNNLKRGRDVDQRYANNTGRYLFLGSSDPVVQNGDVFFFSVCAGGKTRTGIAVKSCKLSQKAGSVKLETITADNRTVLMISTLETGTDTHRHQLGSQTTLIGRYS